MTRYCLSFIMAADLLLGGAVSAFSQSPNIRSGTSGAQFLKLGAGARAGAMADSFAAIADDVSAAYYNPGALYRLSGPQITGSHTQYFQGMNYEVMQFAYPFGRQGDWSRHAFAAGIYYLSVDKLERRASDTTDSVGTFGASDGAYALSYSYGVTRSLGAGVTLKGISQSIDTYHSSAFATDLGVVYRVNPDGRMPLTLAAVLRNWGTRSRLAAGADYDTLPMAGVAAIGIEPIRGRLRLNVEGTKYRDADAYVAAGGEYLHPIGDRMSAALRGGYTSRHKDISGFKGLTLGAGLSYYRATFDFAWLPFGHLGNTFRYSLLIKF